MMPTPMPLKIRVPKSFASTQITAIRIQDIPRNIWYSWDKNSNYPNGYWDNSGGGGNNAPVGQTPIITPGTGTLYIAFYAVNNYNQYVNMSLYIYNGNYNTLAQNVNVYTAPGKAASIQYTGNMPAGPYTIILLSEP